jgi:hypothetical protein
MLSGAPRRVVAEVDQDAGGYVLGNQRQLPPGSVRDAVMP